MNTSLTTVKAVTLDHGLQKALHVTHWGPSPSAQWLALYWAVLLTLEQVGDQIQKSHCMYFRKNVTQANHCPPLCPENGHTCITSNETWSKIKSFMLCSNVSKPTLRTKFLCPALPEKAGLGQPVSTHYLTWFP